MESGNNGALARDASAKEPQRDDVFRIVTDFISWLDVYGKSSWDFQSFYAGPIGKRAKGLYYRNRLVGTAAVAPMVFCEAFLPSGRRLFHEPMRFPIADAHYAMGFAFLYQATSDPMYLERAIDFLSTLEKSRCPGFTDYCWGYPFDWVGIRGVIAKETPLITTTPYVYEAFLHVFKILDGSAQTDASSSDPSRELATKYKEILASIARHAANDIKDFETSVTASCCSYTPYDKGGVVNAAAYRAFLLTSASQLFSRDEYWRIAERNVSFLLESQNPDGSWPYAMDGVRHFVDHFHTCFVLKALAKIHALTGHKGCEQAIDKGVEYYLNNLFDKDGLPKPFAIAPRLVVYKRELYDWAECVNLCLLLRKRLPQLEVTLRTVIGHILKDWIKPDGSFRSRQLHLGWDNVPMHRWAQAQMFRSLAFYLREEHRAAIHDTLAEAAEAARVATLDS